MKIWYDDGEDFGDLEAPHGGEVWMTDNPIIGTILGPTGQPIVEVRERQPIGFHST